MKANMYIFGFILLAIIAGAILVTGQPTTGLPVGNEGADISIPAGPQTSNFNQIGDAEDPAYDIPPSDNWVVPDAGDPPEDIVPNQCFDNAKCWVAEGDNDWSDTIVHVGITSSFGDQAITAVQTKHTQEGNDVKIFCSFDYNCRDMGTDDWLYLEGEIAPRAFNSAVPKTLSIIETSKYSGCCAGDLFTSATVIRDLKQGDSKTVEFNLLTPQTGITKSACTDTPWWQSYHNSDPEESQLYNFQFRVLRGCAFQGTEHNGFYSDNYVLKIGGSP